jgi:hypothetical protein
MCQMFNLQRPTVLADAVDTERRPLLRHLGPYYGMVRRFIEETLKTSQRRNICSITDDKFYIGGTRQTDQTCLAYASAAARQIIKGTAVLGGQVNATNLLVMGNVLGQQGITPDVIRMCT